MNAINVVRIPNVIILLAHLNVHVLMVFLVKTLVHTTILMNVMCVVSVYECT